MYRSILIAVVGCSLLGAGLWFCVTSLYRPAQNHRELGDFGGVVETPRPIYPLKFSDNARFLIDQKGKPVLVVGDTAWSLIAQLGEKDIDAYFEDRQKKGFNAVIVNLIEHKFSSHPPKTRAGLAPFAKPGDFTRPNSEYFDFAHAVVKKAGERGIAVWLAPAYLGHDGGGEGWFAAMKKSGKDAVRTYGRFVGERFRDLPNIVWMIGGDFTPPEEDRWTVTELAQGIRDKDDVHLMTVHGSPGDPVAESFGAAKWFDVNNTYSYDKALFKPLLKDFRRKPVRPFVLIESTYENEHDSKPEQIRRQAYWAMLSGACGQFMGNCPIWHFDGPGVFKPSTTWRNALDQPGSWDMVRLRNVFVGRPWHKLIPDEKNRIVTAGIGEGVGTATTAATADGTLSFSYLPSTGVEARAISVDLEQFTGPVTARWYNPTNGRHTAADGSPFANRGVRELKTPGDNGTNTNDWLLILETK